jgi:sugar phosphate isomerase/epimerase
MSVNKSIVLTALLPEAETEQRLFEIGSSTMKLHDLSVIEFFSPWNKARNRGCFLRSQDLYGVYLAAAYQKRNNSNLCSITKIERKSAVEDAMHCIDAASDAQAMSILFTSGRHPDVASQYISAYCSLVDSLSEIMEYAPRNIEVVLEPGDSSIDAKQLLGPTDDAVRFANDMRKEYPNFSLTMDTSHIAQLGEDVAIALNTAFPVCHHVHLANCILEKNDPWYGDKHPLFSNKKCVYSDEKLHALYEEAVTMFQKERKDLTIGVEVISRNSDGFGWMEDVINESQWFFSKACGKELGL